MILIFGGAYQGKQDFARKKFGAQTVAEYCAAKDETSAAEGSVESPDGAPALPDFAADVICGLEEFTRACTAAGLEAKDQLAACRQEWADKILIVTDVSQGIVPMDKQTRAFREMNGRLMLYLASEADQVWRVFCGIGKQIK